MPVVPAGVPPMGEGGITGIVGLPVLTSAFPMVALDGAFEESFTWKEYTYNKMPNYTSICCVVISKLNFIACLFLELLTGKTVAPLVLTPMRLPAPRCGLFFAGTSLSTDTRSSKIY